MSEARLDVVDTQGFRLAFVALGPAYFAGRLQKLQVVKRSARRKSLRRNATIVAPRVRVILMRTTCLLFRMEHAPEKEHLSSCQSVERPS